MAAFILFWSSLAESTEGIQDGKSSTVLLLVGNLAGVILIGYGLTWLRGTWFVRSNSRQAISNLVEARTAQKKRSDDETEADVAVLQQLATRLRAYRASDLAEAAISAQTTLRALGDSR
jgi:hypothetical protein